jgi:hypothetical protein
MLHNNDSWTDDYKSSRKFTVPLSSQQALLRPNTLHRTRTVDIQHKVINCAKPEHSRTGCSFPYSSKRGSKNVMHVRRQLFFLQDIVSFTQYNRCRQLRNNTTHNTAIYKVRHGTVPLSYIAELLFPL